MYVALCPAAPYQHVACFLTFRRTAHNMLREPLLGRLKVLGTQNAAVPMPAMIASCPARDAQIMNLRMIFFSGSLPVVPRGLFQLAATLYTSRLLQTCGQCSATVLICTLAGATRSAVSMGIATR